MQEIRRSDGRGLGRRGGGGKGGCERSGEYRRAMSAPSVSKCGGQWWCGVERE